MSIAVCVSACGNCSAPVLLLIADKSCFQWVVSVFYLFLLLSHKFHLLKVQLYSIKFNTTIFSRTFVPALPDDPQVSPETGCLSRPLPAPLSSSTSATHCHKALQELAMVKLQEVGQFDFMGGVDRVTGREQETQSAANSLLSKL